MKTKTMDARRLTHATLTELRKGGIASVQAGQSPEVVSVALGIGRATMYGWLARYRDGGWGTLDARKRGGRKPKHNAKAIRWVYRTVTDKNPLLDCIAIVTGRSSGLGEATVRSLMHSGSRTAIFDVQEDRSVALEKESGQNAMFAKAAIFNKDDAKKL